MNHKIPRLESKTKSKVSRAAIMHTIALEVGIHRWMFDGSPMVPSIYRAALMGKRKPLARLGNFHGVV